MADEDYGEDFAGVEDLDFGLTTVSGPRVVAQDVARELITPKGALFYNRQYGNDVRRFLNAALPTNLGTIAASVEATALKDERVYNARASVSFANEALVIVLRLLLATGPFDMTLTVDKLSVELVT